MKNRIILFVCASAFIVFSLSNCTKADDTIGANLFTEQTSQDVLNNQKAIVGSWQFAEKGVEIDMHNGQPCSFTGTKTPMINWQTTTTDDRRDFTSDGAYSRFSEKNITCHGTFKILYDATLAINSDCPTLTETVVGLTTTSLIIKSSNSYFKYQKVN